MLRAAYGLRFASELALPELPAAPGAAAEADVRIRYGRVDEAGLAGGTRVGPFAWASAEALWLQVPAVGRYLVCAGREIVIDPNPGIDEDSLRLFLLGSCLGALLFQRGLLVLHGNAVQVGERCLVCVGPSGAGKSTLAAAFLRRGYPVIADDVTPVDGDGRVLPGIPRIKLWQDSAEQLAIDTGGLRRIRPVLEKFDCPVPQHPTGQAVPLRWVYLLQPENRDGIALEPIPGLQRFLPLRDNTYRQNFLAGMGLGSAHLAQIGRLASQVHLARLRRPTAGFAVDAMVDRILADLAEHP